eukprot:5244065-Amphidinium_carterae.1
MRCSHCPPSTSARAAYEPVRTPSKKAVGKAEARIDAPQTSLKHGQNTARKQQQLGLCDFRRLARH